MLTRVSSLYYIDRKLLRLRAVLHALVHYTYSSWPLPLVPIRYTQPTASLFLGPLTFN